MKVLFAALADAANGTDNGKLNMLGVFLAVMGPELPLINRSMTLGAILQFQESDYGKPIDLVVEIAPVGKQPIWRTPKDMKLPDAPTPSRPGEAPVLNFVLEMVGVKFTSFGDHIVRVVVGSQVVKELPLSVHQIRPQVARDIPIAATPFRTPGGKSH